MKKMRIAHIAGGLTTGGVEAVIYNYSSRFQQEDYELVYISYDPPEPSVQRRFEEIGFTVYSVTKKRDNFIKSCQEVLAIYRRHRINIVHSHMTLISFVTNFLAMLCGIRIRIAHSHLALKTSGIRKLSGSACKALTRLVSTDYFACGEDAARFLFGSRVYSLGKVFILLNAVDPERYAYNADVRMRVRDELNLGELFCVGHIGRFTEQKNHSFLLRVFQRFHRCSPKSILLLIGDGPLADQIRTLAADLGISEAIRFIGSTNRANILYQAMDCFLFPSLYEGLSVVLVEAQYAGLPILSSDTVTREIDISGAIRYMPLDKGTDAWADALADLANRKRTMNPEGLAKAGYDINRQAERLDAFYRQAVHRMER